MPLPRTIYLDPSRTPPEVILDPADARDGDVEYRRPTVAPLVLCSALLVAVALIWRMW